MAASDEIRSWREGNHLTQLELAVLVGKTEGAVYQWESGKVIPRRSTAMKLDEVLGAKGALLNALGYAMHTPADPPAEVDYDRIAGMIRAASDESDRKIDALTDILAEVARQVRILYRALDSYETGESTLPDQEPAPPVTPLAPSRRPRRPTS